MATKRRTGTEISGIPYGEAVLGSRAREKIVDLLNRYDCRDVQILEKFEHHMLVLRFEYRGRVVNLPASAQGWANYALRERPGLDPDRALKQGKVAVWSILLDWLKAQLTATETGLATLERVFLPFMLTGRKEDETVADALLEPGGPGAGLLALALPETTETEK